MPQVIPVDLVASRGKLIPPGALPQPPRSGKEPPPQPPPTAQTPQPTADAAEPHQHAGGGACPRCGWPADLNPNEPTADEMLAFVNSVRTGDLYAQEVSLFEGSARVRFRVLTTTEEDAITAKVLAWIAKERTAGRDVSLADATIHATDFSLSVAVEFLQVGEKRYNYTRPEDPFQADFEARFQQLKADAATSPLYQAVRWQHAAFCAVVGTIQFRATKRSFSQATPSSGSSSAPPSPTG